MRFARNLARLVAIVLVVFQHLLHLQLHRLVLLLLAQHDAYSWTRGSMGEGRQLSSAVVQRNGVFRLSVSAQ